MAEHERNGRPEGPAASPDDPASPGSARLWLLVLGIWTLLGLLESTKAYFSGRLLGYPGSFVHALVGNMPWWYFWALLTPPAVFLARRVNFGTRGPLLTIAFHTVASIVFMLVHLSLTGVLYWNTHSGPTGRVPNIRAQIINFVNAYSIVDLVAYGAIIGCVWALDFYRRYRREELTAARLELRAAQLESTMNQARLDALRMELNPHFLFNTLNAISGLVRRRENDAAVTMLARLGDLLRTTLERDAEQEVPLETELEFLAGYLEIERIRFHDRLVIDMDVEPGALHAMVPTLILQPLVENAVRHGIAPVSGPGLVTVSARRDNGSLVLRVRDSGVGFVNGSSPTRRGVGLSNTESRLRQLYGDAARLELGSDPAGGAAVSVTLPWRTGSEEV